LFLDVPQGTDGTFLEGGEGNIGNDTGFLDELSGLDDFLVTLGREGYIDPTGEFVFKVPC
jgi:hypothetical protein